MSLKLGKAPATHDPRDLLFATYRTAQPLPRRPRHFGIEQRVLDAGGFRMLANGPDDSVAPGFEGAGCCVWSGAANETILDLIAAGMDPKAALALFDGKTTLADYSAVTGYVVGDDATDNGTNVRDALRYRQKTGIVDVHGKRHKIAAYVKLDHTDLNAILEATYLFGAVGIGYEWTDRASQAVENGRVLLPGGRVEGGHYMPNTGQQRFDRGVCWMRLNNVSTTFIEQNADEAWGILSLEALKDGESLQGFDLAALQADLKALRG